MSVEAAQDTGREATANTEVTVTVNNQPVLFTVRKATGTQIKSTAISQSVSIEQDFNLFEVKGPGNLKPVGNDDEVPLHQGQRFRAIAPDDDS
jgi:hypothetical protein